MKSWQQKACEALSVYVERGERGLLLLQEGKVEEALDVLKTRQGAFVNFQSYDQRASFSDAKHAFDLEIDEKINGLILKSMDLEKHLEKRLAEISHSTEEELEKVNRAKKNLQKFKSSQNGMFGKGFFESSA